MKYNKFWNKFDLIPMVHFLPGNLICLQQALFGPINIQLKILLILTFFIGIVAIVPTSIFVCLLAKNMKAYRKQLLRLIVAPNLILNVKIKLKVN